MTERFLIGKPLKDKVSFLYRVSHKKGINKKLSVGAAHSFKSQFFNLFGFSISVRFVQCII